MVFNKVVFKGFLFTISFIILTSCGGSGSSSGSTSTSSGFVKFKLNGSDWESSDANPDNKFDVDAITDHSTLVRVEAFAKDGSYFTLNVHQTSGISTGTYPITDQGMSGFFKYVPTDGDGYVSNGMPDNPGSITISTLTEEKVAGTFYFRLRNAANPDEIIEITEGEFDVEFAEY